MPLSWDTHPATQRVNDDPVTVSAPFALEKKMAPPCAGLVWVLLLLPMSLQHRRAGFERVGGWRVSVWVGRSGGLPLIPVHTHART